MVGNIEMSGKKKLVYVDDRFLKQHCAHLIVRRVSRFEVVAFRARVFEERHWELNKLTSTTVFPVQIRASMTSVLSNKIPTTNRRWQSTSTGRSS